MLCQTNVDFYKSSNSDLKIHIVLLIYSLASEIWASLWGERKTKNIVTVARKADIFFIHRLLHSANKHLSALCDRACGKQGPHQWSSLGLDCSQAAWHRWQFLCSRIQTQPTAVPRMHPGDESGWRPSDPDILILGWGVGRHQNDLGRMWALCPSLPPEKCSLSHSSTWVLGSLFPFYFKLPCWRSALGAQSPFFSTSKKDMEKPRLHRPRT